MQVGYSIYMSSIHLSLHEPAAIRVELNPISKKNQRNREKRGKKLKMEQDEMRKGPWTEQEDILLVNFVHVFGDRRWDFIAKVSGLKVWRETNDR